MRIKACLTSNNQLWKTPKNIYQSFMDRGFFDPCPGNSNFDGLKIEWSDKNFVNPPYNAIDEWIDKALEEVEKGKHIVLLIPARTDTRWFRKLYEANGHFRFIQGRLHFNESNSAPFPSMFVLLDKKNYYPTMMLLTKEDMEIMYGTKKTN
ncbi:MAG: hypothetical protein J6T10_19715 [Methanobrevibacter sp.]|nr:hypothetical protein [Methanobrevibacter sp.]